MRFQDAHAERLAQMRDYFASLPPERFPNSVALAGLIAAGETDDRFEFGLEVLTRGLAAAADQRSRPSARPVVHAELARPKPARQWGG
jgi:hypothetical protein